MMLNALYILLIGFMAGIIPTILYCEYFYRKRLQDIEDHWTITFNNSTTEWSNFYKAEVKRWQTQTAELVEQAAHDAARATNELWRGKKIEKPKPSN